MDIDVRLADGSIDSFRDHNPQADRGITRHSYEVRDEALVIAKAVMSCRYHQVIDGLIHYRDMGEDYRSDVAYYRPDQWISVREA